MQAAEADRVVPLAHSIFPGRKENMVDAPLRDQEFNSQAGTATSEHARAEEAIRMTQQHFSNVLESITDCFYALDPEFRFTYVNRQTETYFGLPKEQMLSRIITDVFPKKRNHEIWLKLQQALREQQTQQIEFLSPTTGKWGEMIIYPAVDGLSVYFHDITALKQTEEALRESEARRHLALDAAGLGTFLYHPLEDRGEPDARMLALFGLHEGDTLNLAEALAKMIYPDDRDFYAAKVAQSLDPQGGGKLDAEIRVVHGDGSLHWIAVTAQNVFEGEPPQPVRMYGVAADITERKRREANLAFLAETSADFAPLLGAEEIMERVGERLAVYLKLSRCNFSVVDEESDFIECIYAWRRDDSLPDVSGAHHISTFLSEEGRRHYAEGKVSIINNTRNNPLINPATLETFDELNQSSIVDVPYLKDGRWKFLLTVARSEVGEWRTDEIDLIRELAERIYIRLERARAEEDLRESERRMTMLFQHAQNAILLADDESRYVDANPAACQLTGFTREELLQKNVWDLTPAPGLERGRQLWREFIRAGQQTGEYPLRCKDGELRIVDFRAVANIMPGLHLSILHDVTERKQTEADLQRANNELAQTNVLLQDKEQERNRLLRRLITVQEVERQRLSWELHDQTSQHLVALRMMLATMSGMLPSQPEQQDSLAQIQQLAEQLGHELHTLAWNMRPTRVKERGLATALAEYVQEWAARSQITADFHCRGNAQRRFPEVLEITVYRVVQEALTNVLKHAQAQQVSVLLEYFPQRLRVVIEDNGVGFVPQPMESQHDGAAHLGLMSMRERLALVDGALEIESTPGQGTAIYLSIPISATEPAEGAI